MTFDFATYAQPILKNTYLPGLQEMLPNSTPLLKQFEKETLPIEGKAFKVQIHRGRNEAAGRGAAELATLPTAGRQTYMEGSYNVKTQYSRIALSGVAIAATKSNKGSAVRALDAEMKRIFNDTKRSFNQQANSDGRHAFAFWTATDITSGTNVDDNLGNGTTYLEPSAQTFDVIDTDNTTVNGTAIVVTRGARSAATTAITWTGTVASGADGDYLVPTGTFGKQMTGIQAIVSAADPVLQSGGLGGLAVATYDDWKAVILGSDASRQDLSFELIDQLIANIAMDSDADASDVNFLHCHPAMVSTYAKLCKDNRVFYNNMTLDGGFKVAQYDGKAFSGDKDCRRNAIFALTPGTISMGQMAPLDWLGQESGGIFYRLSGGDKDGLGATLYMYGEFIAKVRNQNGALLGLNEIWS
jgi:hypothetical protein